MVQLLSSDCVSSFVELVYAMCEEREKEEPGSFEPDISFNHTIKYEISVLERDSHVLGPDADEFVASLDEWLRSWFGDDPAFNVDERVKLFCMGLIERARSSRFDEPGSKRERFRDVFVSSKRKIYATVYMSLYVVFNGLNDVLDLTRFRFEPGCSRHCQYFIFRVMSHKEADPDDADADRLFSEWLHCLYERLVRFAQSSGDLVDRLGTSACVKLVLDELDCYSRVNQTRARRESRHDNTVVSILKSSWIYLIDVLTGCLMHTDLADVEKVLFYDAGRDLLVDNADFSFVVFTLRSTLDSLARLLALVAGLASMDNELNQLFVILVDTNFLRGGALVSCDDLTLNKIVCLDFVLFSCLSMVCDALLRLGYVPTHLSISYTPETSLYTSLADRVKTWRRHDPAKYESNPTLWRYLVESVFYCLNLQNSLGGEPLDDAEKVPSLPSSRTEKAAATAANFILKNTNLLKSVYESHRPSQQQHRVSSESNLITADEIGVKIETVFHNVFHLIGFNKATATAVSKSTLVDELATNVADCLFNKLFAEPSPASLVYLWNMSAHLCATSRRFLLRERPLKGDYFAFNNLVIDKIEEFVAKIVAKLELAHVMSGAAPSTSLLPNYELTLNYRLAKDSIYSVFFLDLWFHVYVAYFRSVFSKCGRLDKISKSAARNKLPGNKLRNFSILDSIRSFNTTSNERVVVDTDDSLDTKNLLVDISLFKKLICLIQKVRYLI